jgi:hypothetical protein
MAEAYSNPQAYTDVNTQLRDLEEKQRLLRERVLLIGQSIIDERDKTFKAIQEIKKELFNLKEENNRMKEFMQRITEQLSDVARKEEVMTLQRQFDLFRKE